GRASRAPVTWPAVPWAGRPGRLRLPRDVYIRLLDGAALARRRPGSDDLVDRPDLDESDLPARTDRVRQTPVVRRVRDEEPELAAEVFADRLRPRPEDPARRGCTSADNVRPRGLERRVRRQENADHQLRLLGDAEIPPHLRSRSRRRPRILRRLDPAAIAAGNGQIDCTRQLVDAG